jgi:putative acetyltransferase
VSGVWVRIEEQQDRRVSLEIETLAFGGPEEAAIVERVRDEDGSFALVAVDGELVVGHVQLSRAWIGEQAVLALGPIGVHPDRQGVGIGSSLVPAALDEARRRGEVAVILLGSPDFYPRFGFRPASRWGLRNAFTGLQEDGFMLAPLVDPAPSFAGEVRWHPAFGQPVEAPDEPR